MANNPFAGLSPRTPFGASGQGAIGGPRGVGAGALRYLVEFIAAFDSSALKQLEVELNRVQGEQAANAAQINKLEATRDKFQNKLVANQKILKAGYSGVTGELKKIDQAQQRINELERKKTLVSNQGAATQAKLTAEITKQRNLLEASKNAILGTVPINRNQLRDLINRAAISERVKKINADIALLEEEQNALAAEGNAIKAEGARILSVQQNLIPRLSALALGAVGGLAGAALLQPAFDALQGAFDTLKKGFTDIIDPAANARDAIKDVSGAINEFADVGNGSKFDAAIAQIKSLGDLGGAENLDASILALVPALEKVNEQEDQITKELETQFRIRELMSGAVNKDLQNTLRGIGGGKGPGILDAIGNVRNFNQVLDELRAKGDAAANDQSLLAAALNGDTTALNGLIAEGSEWARNLRDQSVANVNAKITLDAYGQSADQAAESQQKLNDAFAQVQLDNMVSDIQAASDAVISGIERSRDAVINAANTAADAAIDRIKTRTENAIDGIRDASEKRIKTLQDKLDALELIPSARTNQLQKQLDALKDAGPSKETLRLADAIAKLNEAEKQRAYNLELSNAREEKRLFILKHDLENTNQQINIEKYQGKARLVALDAQIERLQKQSEIQNRFNERLKLQYQLGQKMQRQQGETIQDFIERRAQANSDILQQAAELDRADRIDRLGKMRDNLEYEIELKQKNADITEIIRQHDLQQHLDSLQKQLDASKDRDQKELDSRKASLQKQLDASKKADQDELDHKKKVIQDEIDAERDRAQKQIDATQKASESQIKQVEHVRDVIVATANKTADMAIDAERRRAQATVDLMRQNQEIQYALALAGAQSQQNLAYIAGHLVGFQFTDAQISAMLQSYGFNQQQIAAQLGQVDWWRNFYSQQLSRIQNPGLPGGAATTIRPPGAPGGYASGGVFELTNAMNFGRDFRVGDGAGGKELGIVLSNQVYKALRDSEQGMSIGELNYYGQGQDSKWDMYHLEKVVEGVINRKLR